MPKCCEISLAPDQSRDVGDDIFFKRSCRRQFGNEGLMQFFELGWIFAGENSCRGIATMFESGMTFFELRHQTTPRLTCANHRYTGISSLSKSDCGNCQSECLIRLSQSQQ